MIVIDTNVVSEMMREAPDSNVLRWCETVGRLHTTAITLAEVDYGLARLPEGRRKDWLAATAATVFADYDELILSFDACAARRYGSIISERENSGRPIATVDAQIAAICATHGATLATRNTADFEETGIDLVNPWDEELSPAQGDQCPVRDPGAGRTERSPCGNALSDPRAETHCAILSKVVGRRAEPGSCTYMDHAVAW